MNADTLAQQLNATKRLDMDFTAEYSHPTIWGSHVWPRYTHNTRHYSIAQIILAMNVLRFSTYLRNKLPASLVDIARVHASHLSWRKARAENKKAH